MLCRMLLTELEKDFEVAYILNPYLDPMALFVELASELGLPRPTSQLINQHEVLNAVTRRVLELNAQGKRVVICLDEVQAMPVATLEALRLLTNLETEDRKLLQVIIFGQPELDTHLNLPSVRQLRQRITFQYTLKPLNASEFTYYLQHRLATAGYQRGPLFTPTALWWLQRRSRCVPRLINILANKALMSAYGRGERMVGLHDVMRAVRDTNSAHRNRAESTWLWLFIVAMLAGVGLVAVALGTR
jgi:MSHA biogenesis protein MshM